MPVEPEAAFPMCENHDLMSTADTAIRASTINKIRMREHRIEELEPGVAL
jgi:hypothetical protein